MSKQKWSDLIDKTVLVVPSNDRSAGPFEYTVRAVSPSGTNLKLENRAGRTFWCKSGDYLIEEVLAPKQ